MKRGKRISAPLVSELHKTAAAQRAEARTLRKNAAAAKDPPSLEALQKKANEYAKVFTDQYAKREFSPAAKTGNEIVGNYAVALVTEWGKNYDQNLENLRAWGHNLRESDGKPAIVKDLNESLRKEVLALEQKYRSSKMTGALANLRDLANTLATMLGDTKGLEAATKTMTERADADDASADEDRETPAAHRWQASAPGRLLSHCPHRPRSRSSHRNFQNPKTVTFPMSPILDNWNGRWHLTGSYMRRLSAVRHLSPLRHRRLAKPRLSFVIRHFTL